MTLLKVLLISFFYLFNVNNSFAEEHKYYIAKGETVSDILFALGSKHIYGKKGHLKKTLELNPVLKKSAGNKIYPGMKLIIPFGTSNKTMEVAFSPKDDSKKNPEVPLISVMENNEKIENEKNEIKNQKVVFRSISSEYENTSNYGQYYFFRMMPQVSWMQITSNSQNQYLNSEIKASTKQNWGLLFNSGIAITNKQNVSLFAYLSQINFYAPEAFTLNKLSYFRQAYGIGGETVLDSGYKINYRIGFFDEYYLSMPDINSIKMEMAQIPEVHFGFKGKGYSIGNVSMVNGVFGKLIIPYNNGQVNGKFGYGAGADSTIKLFNRGIRSYINYSNAKATGKSTSSFEVGFNMLFEVKMFD